MKTVAAVLALLVFCRPGPAQTKSANQLSPNVRLYEPMSLTPERASRVAAFVQSVVGPGCLVAWEGVPHAIVIRSQNPSDLDAAEALLRRFDMPERMAAVTVTVPPTDCTVYLIRASSTPAAAPSNQQPASPPTSSVPADLQSAIDEMKHSFGYDRYSLWDSLAVRVNGSGGEMQGILPMDSGSAPYIYTMTYQRANSGEGKNVYLYGFEFSIKMPSAFYKDGIESHMKTDVTIHEDQKLVLGKIRLLPSENADLFLVLATKFH
jgi:hypothetical protein